MKKKVLIMTGIGLVLLGAVLAAALNAVFTVTDVRVNFSLLSETGRNESLELQEKLDKAFVGKSTTFLDLEEVTAIVGEYPGFKVEKAEKDFPRTVVLDVTERRETLSFRRENGLYAVMDESGLFLYDRETNANRLGGENILLEGFALTADRGAKAQGQYFEEVLSFVSVFSQAYGDARANIRSVTLLNAENPIVGSHILRIRMQEGVAIDIFEPSRSIKEKAEKVLQKYEQLSDLQRLYGFFDVVELGDGSGFTVSEHRPQIPTGV